MFPLLCADHPAWAVLYEDTQLRDYVKTFDVVGTDPYPIGADPINHPYNKSSANGQESTTATHALSTG